MQIFLGSLKLSGLPDPCFKSPANSSSPTTSRHVCILLLHSACGAKASAALSNRPACSSLDLACALRLSPTAPMLFSRTRSLSTSFIPCRVSPATRELRVTQGNRTHSTHLKTHVPNRESHYTSGITPPFRPCTYFTFRTKTKWPFSSTNRDVHIHNTACLEHFDACGHTTACLRHSDVCLNFTAKACLENTHDWLYAIACITKSGVCLNIAICSKHVTVCIKHWGKGLFDTACLRTFGLCLHAISCLKNFHACLHIAVCRKFSDSFLYATACLEQSYAYLH